MIRRALAVLFVGLGLAGAAAVYGESERSRCVLYEGDGRSVYLTPRVCVERERSHESWGLPGAIAAATVGCAAAAAVAQRRRRSET